MNLYAIGKPGQPVRIIISVETDDGARALRLTGEQAHTLSRMPTVPVMITADGQDVVAVPVTLAQAQAARWTAAKLVRTQKENAGCTTAKGVIQTDPASRSNINSAAADALRWKMSNILVSQAGVTVSASSTSWSRSWMMLDNTPATMNADDMVAVANAVSAYLDMVHQASNAIRTAIFAAKTVAAVKAVDIGAGYP